MTKAEVSPRPLFYVAHPVGADTTDEIAENFERAKRWLGWLWRTYPEADFCAPWLGNLKAWLDGPTPADGDRDRHLAMDVRIARSFDAVALCGPRISQGMDGEAEANGIVWDLTGPILPGCQEGGPPPIKLRIYSPSDEFHMREPIWNEVPYVLRPYVGKR